MIPNSRLFFPNDIHYLIVCEQEILCSSIYLLYCLDANIPYDYKTYYKKDWVSRGGYKLDAVLKRFKLDVGLSDHTIGNFATGDSIGSYSVASTNAVINTVTPPEIVPNTGEILFAQNMKPIEKDPEQREQYQIILKF